MLLLLFGNHTNILVLQVLVTVSKSLPKIPKSGSQSVKLQLQCVSVDSVWYRGFGYSSVPVKEHLVDNASAVYRAVQSAETDPELGDRGRHSASMQSKSFQVLTHMTRAESSKFVVLNC